jgi:hypothetical protein
VAPTNPDEQLLEHLVDQEKEERNERRGLEQRALSIFVALLIGIPVVGAVAKDADYGSLTGRLAMLALLVALYYVLAITIRISAALSTNAPSPKEEEAGTSPDAKRTPPERSLGEAVKITFTRERPAKGSSGVREARLAVASHVKAGSPAQAGEHQADVVRYLRHENKFMVGEVREATRRVPLVLTLLVLGLALLVASKEPAAEPAPGPQGERGPAGPKGPVGPQGPKGRRGPADPAD